MLLLLTLSLNSFDVVFDLLLSRSDLIHITRESFINNCLYYLCIDLYEMSYGPTLRDSYPKSSCPKI